MREGLMITSLIGKKPHITRFLGKCRRLIPHCSSSIPLNQPGCTQQNATFPLAPLDTGHSLGSVNMNISAFLMVSLFSLTASERIRVLYSAATPFNVSEVVSIAREEGWEVEGDLGERGEKVEGVVLDYLYEETLSNWVGRTSEQGNYYRMWGEDSSGVYTRDFSAYIQALNLSNVYLLGDTTTIALVTNLVSTYPWLYSGSSILPADLDLDFALQFVGRQIKPRGIHYLALFLSAPATQYFLRALQAKKLNRAGYVYVLSQRAGRYHYLSACTSGLLGNGVLIVGGESEAEPSLERLEAKRLGNALKLRLSQASIQPQFNLFYTQANTLIKVASTPSAIHSTHILFPGNTTAFPKPTKATIRASVNYQVANPDGSPYPIAAQVMRGFQVAFQEANHRSDLLPYYHLEDYSVGFTGSQFSFNFSLPLVKAALQELGVVYMALPVSQTIMGMAAVFNSLNISLPIASSAIGSALSDPHIYPFFVRPRPSNKYTYTVVGRMIQYFGWSQVAFLYSADGGDGEDAYRQFSSVKDDFGINITNPEALRVLPVILNSHTAAQVNISLQAIIQSTTRIIVIYHIYEYILMEHLYDLGIREQYVQIYVTGIANAIFQGPTNYRRRVVSKGALMFFPRLFIGTIGQSVYQELAQIDGQNLFPNTCLYYDAAYLYFYATQYLLDAGYDYEDSHEIMRAMRGTYFHGCSGLVRIEMGTNDRAASEIVITNFQYNQSSDTFTLKAVGSFNPFATQLYQLTSPIQWPDDLPTYADSKPLYLSCPFLAEIVQEMPYGGVVGVSISGFLTVHSVVMALVLGKSAYRQNWPPLDQKHNISVGDMLVLSTVLVDYFQLATLVADLESLSHTLKWTYQWLSMEVAGFPTVTEGVYWAVLGVILGLVYGWVVLCVLVRAGWKWVLCWEVLKFWWEVLMPNFFFVPIISALTSVFHCTKGISDQPTDSFFDKDCREFCWRDMHLGYAVACGLALIVYIPLAMQTRILWQEVEVNLHVKTRPVGILVKSTLQVALIAANSLNQTVQTYVSVGIMLLYLVFMLLVQQHNYARLSLWQVLLTVALLSLLLCVHLSPLAVSEYWLLGVLGEYVVLVGVGLLLQTCVRRFQSKLKREPSKDVRGLFAFAFTVGRRARAGLQRYITSNPTDNPISEQAIVLEVT